MRGREGGREARHPDPNPNPQSSCPILSCCVVLCWRQSLEPVVPFLVDRFITQLGLRLGECEGDREGDGDGEGWVWIQP